MRNLVSKSMILSLVLLLFFCTVTLAEENTTSATTAADDFGRAVSIAGTPERIVSLSPSITEILFALGLGDQVVRVTKYCDYPPTVKKLKDSGKIEVVDGYVDPDIEMILTLHPDLVLASGTHSSGAVSPLDKESIPNFVVDSNNLSGIILSIEKIGKIT